jgi:hypothetical protein
MMIALALLLAAQDAPAGQFVPPIGQPPVQTMVVEPVAMMLAACDADGDARTTRDEARACVAKSFASVDGADSGSIGYIGYSDWATRWLGDASALPGPFEVDADHDNRDTLAELTARIDTIFTRLDRDKDDALVRAELLTVRAVPQGFGRRRR